MVSVMAHLHFTVFLEPHQPNKQAFLLLRASASLYNDNGKNLLNENHLVISITYIVS